MLRIHAILKRGNIWGLFPNREHLLFCKETEPKELLGTFVTLSELSRALVVVLSINDAKSLGFKNCLIEMEIFKSSYFYILDF